MIYLIHRITDLDENMVHALLHDLDLSLSKLIQKVYTHSPKLIKSHSLKNYKNHYRRNRFKSNNERNFHKNGNGQQLSSDFSSNSNFKRRNPGRNNQNAPKLVEKYANLAREALSNGDKILSENYFQHADHFIRIQLKKENDKNNVHNNSEQINEDSSSDSKKEISEQNISDSVELNSSES